MATYRHLLGASARFDILRALMDHPQPVGIRPLARLTRLHPHSVERTISELVEEGLAKQTRERNQVLTRRCPDHPDWQILEAVFAAGDRAVHHTTLPDRNRRAAQILPFIEDALQMVHNARIPRHVS